LRHTISTAYETKPIRLGFETFDKFINVNAIIFYVYDKKATIISMPQMDDIARLLKELEAELSRCARCGMCQAVCPLFSETGLEADVARGKLALLDGLLEKLLDHPQGTMDRLNRCLLCGSCAVNCPNGVNVLEIFLKARTILYSVMGLSPFKKVLLKRILANPDTFNRIFQWGIKFQKWVVKSENKTIGTSSLRFSPPFLGKRHFVPLAPIPFHQRALSAKQAISSFRMTVLFFTGCLIDKIFPQIADAVLKVLHHHQIDVIVPKEQGCCGIPAISSGDADTMNQLICHNLEQFEGKNFDFLITACATCTHTIKNIWPMMVRDYSDDVKANISALSKKTMDINQFIVSKIRRKEGPPMPFNDPCTITYHDPCHLKKSLGVYTEPRTLIMANPQYRFVEMAEADWCCGMGGSFNIEHYDLSHRIGNRKLENIRTAGCQVVATGCPACMIQLSDMLSKSGEEITVKHPIEIYAESLKSLKQ